MHNIIQEVFKWQCKLTSLSQSIAIFAGVAIIFLKNIFHKPNISSP
ncbi:uncharacterized protein METZ01_LOCUS147941 [marine metagenome]|uniref:Uncharacterized protein n=1 Tax=marine metagenome TaxID=408172 RepID=A0A382A1Z1_9ZZZZ